MHRFSSRSDERDDMSARPASGYPPRARAPACRSGAPALRVGGTRLRVGGAARRMMSSLRSDEGGVGAVENLCIIRAKTVIWVTVLQWR